MCDNCDYDSNNLYNPKLIVCKTCRNTKPSLLITKSGATEQYPLSPGDFDNVRHIEYHGGIYVTYLYLIKDIKQLCILKHGSEEKYVQIMKTKLKKKNDKKAYAENSRKFRTKELDDYLKSIFLPGIRNDSTLCTNYIDKGDAAGYTKEQIGVIMTEMKFYYEKTRYSSILYKLKGEEFEFRREHKGWCNWTEDDEEDVRNEAKEKALYEYIDENCDNNHQLILEIPKSLKRLADAYYDKLWRQGKIGRNMVVKDVTKDIQPVKVVSQSVKVVQPIVQPVKVQPVQIKDLPKQKYTFEEICKRFTDSKEKFSKTQLEYDALIKN